jgi:hypothetical protein
MISTRRGKPQNREGIMKISDGILETMRAIHTDSEIKFAPEGTTAADLFGEYEDIEDEDEDYAVCRCATKTKIELVELDDLY